MMLLRSPQKTLEETNVSDPVSLAKDKNLSTVCGVVEISSETSEKTNCETIAVFNL